MPPSLALGHVSLGTLRSHRPDSGSGWRSRSQPESFGWFPKMDQTESPSTDCALAVESREHLAMRRPVGSGVSW